MKKVLLVITIVTILLLDWAALDDITTGNEPNYLGEYATIFTSFAIFGYLFGRSWHRKAFKLQKKISRNTILKKYHFHHSLTGLILFLIGIFLKPSWLGVILAGLGAGLFLHHLLSEGLNLISFQERR